MLCHGVVTVICSGLCSGFTRTGYVLSIWQHRGSCCSTLLPPVAVQPFNCYAMFNRDWPCGPSRNQCGRWRPMHGATAVRGLAGARLLADVVHLVSAGLLISPCPCSLPRSQTQPHSNFLALSCSQLPTLCINCIPSKPIARGVVSFGRCVSADCGTPLGSARTSRRPCLERCHNVLAAGANGPLAGSSLSLSGPAHILLVLLWGSSGRQGGARSLTAATGQACRGMHAAEAGAREEGG